MTTPMTTPPTYVGRVRGVALLAALVLPAGLLAACGDDEPGDPPTSTPSAAPSTAQSTASGASPSASPAPSDTAASPATSAPPEVAPAAGPELRLDGFTLHLPEGWKVQTNGGVSANGFDPGGTLGQVAASRADAVGVETVDYLADEAIGTARRNGLKPVRQDDREVGGVEGFVVTGSNELSPFYYEFGTVTGGVTISVTITFGQETPDAMDYVDSVLASVQLS